MYENINSNYINYLKTKNILIVGVTLRSGVSVSNTLYKLNVPHSLTDSKEYKSLATEREALLNKNAIFHTGHQSSEILDEIDLIILSPGVPLKSNLMKEAINKKIEIISEIEFAYNIRPKINYIAITGTDGKTTTATLTHKIISASKKARLLGNVGNTFSKDVLFIDENETVILELSSFQLETIDKFKPNISVLLNIADDHLDRYSDINEYFDAKKNIYKNQKSDDKLILNMDNEYTASLIENVNNASILTYSTKNKNATIYLDDDDNIYYYGELLFSIKERVIIGSHNRENILVSTLIALKENIETNIIKHQVNAFKGLPHRMEIVRSINGVTFINDSKATSLSSVLASIKSFNKNIILIMGGQNKGIDFRPILDDIKNKVKVLILIGEARHELEKMLPYEKSKIIENFDEAFNYAYSLSEEGDTVLLSPGCTSFDSFKNYEERGNYFKSLVNSLKN